MTWGSIAVDEPRVKRLFIVATVRGVDIELVGLLEHLAWVLASRRGSSSKKATPEP